MRSLPFSMHCTCKPTADSLAVSSAAKCSSFAGFAAADSPGSVTSLIPAAHTFAMHGSLALDCAEAPLQSQHASQLSTVVGEQMQHGSSHAQSARGSLTKHDNAYPTASSEKPPVRQGDASTERNTGQTEREMVFTWRDRANAIELWPAGGQAQLQVQDREFFDSYFQHDELIYEERMRAFYNKHGFGSWSFGVPFESQVRDTCHPDCLCSMPR